MKMSTDVKRSSLSKSREQDALVNISQYRACDGFRWSLDAAYVVLKSVSSHEIAAELARVMPAQHIEEVLDALSVRACCSQQPQHFTVVLENSKHHRYRVALPNIVGALRRDGAARFVACVTVPSSGELDDDVWPDELLYDSGAHWVGTLHELHRLLDSEALSNHVLTDELLDREIVQASLKQHAPSVVVGAGPYCASKSCGESYERESLLPPTTTLLPNASHDVAQDSDPNFSCIHASKRNRTDAHQLHRQQYSDADVPQIIQFCDDSDDGALLSGRMHSQCVQDNRADIQGLSDIPSSTCAYSARESERADACLSLSNAIDNGVSTSNHELRSRHGAARLIVVTGLQGGSGATSVAEGLACWYAGHRIKTLLIDVQPFRHECAQHFGVASVTQEPEGLAPSQMLAYQKRYAQEQDTMIKEMACDISACDERIKKDTQQIATNLLLFELVPRIGQAHNVRHLIVDRCIERARQYAQVVVVNAPILYLLEASHTLAHLDRLITTLAPRALPGSLLQSHVRFTQDAGMARTRHLFVINGLTRQHESEELVTRVRHQIAITAVKTLPYAGDKLTTLQESGQAIRYFTGSHRHALALAQLACDIGTQIGLCKPSYHQLCVDGDSDGERELSVMQRVSSFLRGEAA